MKSRQDYNVGRNEKREMKWGDGEVIIVMNRRGDHLWPPQTAID
jgi:hypothetical protein